MTGVHAPPPTGIEYAFQMPVLFEENRKRDSSAEKPAPRTPVTFMNCSIVYCFDGRAWAVAGRRGLRVTVGSHRRERHERHAGPNQ